MPVSAGELEVVTLMDVEDFERLDGRCLSLGSHGYAQIWADRKTQTVHRWVTGTTGQGYTAVVDHINRDKLDNRRSNLRLVTASDSNLNRPQMDGEFVGVFMTRHGKFEAKFKWQGRRHYVGTFVTREEARDALRNYRRMYAPKSLVPLHVAA